MLSVHFHDSIRHVDATSWDSLLGGTNPFVSHAFLAGLERHACIRPEWGWQPHHLTLHEDDRLVAAAPLYLKSNSHGEYVFDWAWADAWERAGGRYYPKLLCAVPYSPVTGPRLLAGTRAQRSALANAITEETCRLGLSSAHVDFPSVNELNAMETPWLPRFDWQYHWHNRGYHCFDDFLATLKHKKRKNIRTERAQVRLAGIRCSMHRGDSLTDLDWHAVHALYLRTYQTKGNLATLTLPFFRHLADTSGDRMQVAVARERGDIIAMALFLRSENTLYGRYWGARQYIPALHFELCYYLGIEHAIACGLDRFEPGAQGPHKLARGFIPVRTHSRHYIVHEGFRRAVAAALEDEAAAMREIGDQLRSHSPYHEEA